MEEDTAHPRRYAKVGNIPSLALVGHVIDTLSRLAMRAIKRKSSVSTAKVGAIYARRPENDASLLESKRQCQSGHEGKFFFLRIYST